MGLLNDLETRLEQEVPQRLQRVCKGLWTITGPSVPLAV